MKKTSAIATLFLDIGQAPARRAPARQAPARQVIYIENTPMVVQIAEGLWIRSILHTDDRSPCASLASFG